MRFDIFLELSFSGSNLCFCSFIWFINNILPFLFMVLFIFFCLLKLFGLFSSFIDFLLFFKLFFGLFFLGGFLLVFFLLFLDFGPGLDSLRF